MISSNSLSQEEPFVVYYTADDDCAVRELRCVGGDALPSVRKPPSESAELRAAVPVAVAATEGHAAIGSFSDIENLRSQLAQTIGDVRLFALANACLNFGDESEGLEIGRAHV